MLRYGILIAVTIGFSILDIVTGYLGALIKKSVSSSKMRTGLIKKAIIIVVISAAVLLQVGQQYVDLGFDVPIVSPVCAIVIWMELTSILENADKIFNGKLKAIVDKFLSHKK